MRAAESPGHSEDHQHQPDVDYGEGDLDPEHPLRLQSGDRTDEQRQTRGAEEREIRALWVRPGSAQVCGRVEVGPRVPESQRVRADPEDRADTNDDGDQDNDEEPAAARRPARRDGNLDLEAEPVHTVLRRELRPEHGGASAESTRCG